MTSATYPGRLALHIKRMSELIPVGGGARSTAMALNLAQMQELDQAWRAACETIQKIQVEIETSGRLTESQKRGFSRKLNRIEEWVGPKGLLQAGDNFLKAITSDKMNEDLEDLHSQFDAIGITEALSDEEAARLAQLTRKLKDAVLNSKLDQKIKLNIAALLSRMQEIFETYNLLGEQDLQATVERWTGVLVAHNDLLSNAPELKTDSVRLTAELWKIIRKGADFIQITQAYTAVAIEAAKRIMPTS